MLHVVIDSGDDSDDSVRSTQTSGVSNILHITVFEIFDGKIQWHRSRMVQGQSLWCQSVARWRFRIWLSLTPSLHRSTLPRYLTLNVFFNDSFLSPKNYPFSFGILTPHLIRNSLGPCKPITYGIPVGFAFLHSSLQNAPTFYNGLPLHHKNVSSHGEIWTPI